MSEIEKKALSPILRLNLWFWVTSFILVFLAIVTLVALYIYNTEEKLPTELYPESYWGIHITNFVFYMALGFGAILVSVALRLRRTDWSAGVYRITDFAAVIAFVVAGFNIVFEIGDILWLVDIILYGQVDSPFIWDGLLLIFFIIAAAAYMYMAMVPDLTRTSLRVHEIKAFYRFLSFGYVGNPIQRVRLRKMVLRMAILVFLVLLLMTTVLAWAFEDVSPHPVWNEALTGPLFIAEAIVLALAVIILMLAVLRSAEGFQDFLTRSLFIRLGKALAYAILLYLPLFIIGTLTMTSGEDSTFVSLSDSVWNNEFAYLTWGIAFFGLVIPLLIVIQPRLASIRFVVVAATMTALVLMFKIYMVVVPGITRHLNAYGDGIYWPTLVEWVLIIGSLSFFIILMVAMTRFFPMVSVWEIEDQIREEDDKGVRPG
jgi:molybdopterin-containing oxidoreductase family membrane subunit